MNHFVTRRIRIEKDLVTRVRRSLRGKGSLNITLGQEVTPDEIIGSSQISAGFRMLNLSQLLSVSPKYVEKFMLRRVGQRIYKDELLAFKKGGLLSQKKTVIAPTDGVLDFLNPLTGELRMSFLPKKADLPAGVYGIVEHINKEKGQVIIRTQVSRIHGMFGSGRLRDGILHILNKRDDLISRSVINSKYDENILVGGSLFFKDAISSCISVGVNGIITGGMNAKDYKSMSGGRLIFPKKLDNDIGISVVICEGFGSIPLGEDIFALLSGYEGKFVTLDGNRAIINLPSFESNSILKIRGVKLSPIQDEESILEDDHPAEITELKIGSNVRVVGNSYAGEQGKVISVDETATLLASGIRTSIATIQGSRRKIQVPVANLEVI